MELAAAAKVGRGVTSALMKVAGSMAVEAIRQAKGTSVELAAVPSASRELQPFDLVFLSEQEVNNIIEKLNDEERISFLADLGAAYEAAVSSGLLEFMAKNNLTPKWGRK